MRRKPISHSHPVNDGTVECRHDETGGWKTVLAVKRRRRTKNNNGLETKTPRLEGPDRSPKKLWQYVLKLIGVTERRKQK